MLKTIFIFRTWTPNIDRRKDHGLTTKRQRYEMTSWLCNIAILSLLKYTIRNCDLGVQKIKLKSRKKGWVKCCSEYISSDAKMGQIHRVT